MKARTTITGNFNIGFCRGGSPWQKNLSELINWALDVGYGSIDLGTDGDKTADIVINAGLKVGTCTLPDMRGMLSSEKKDRDSAVAENSDYIEACNASGVDKFFVVMLPTDPQRERKDNFSYMIDSYSRLVPVLEKTASCVVVEGWPGPGALCCTPETYRALFNEIPSSAMGVNYDPSHLLRMGIDPLRFLNEFIDRIYHVHGKDTEIIEEGLYEYGHEQDATYAKKISFGNQAWRYTIPGHGVMRWLEAFDRLDEGGYKGIISVELEDANFNGSEEGEKVGLLKSLQYLEGC